MLLASNLEATIGGYSPVTYVRMLGYSRFGQLNVAYNAQELTQNWSDGGLGGDFGVVYAHTFDETENDHETGHQMHDDQDHPC